MARPERGRQAYTVALAPETLAAIKALAREQATYPGDIIDRAIRTYGSEQLSKPRDDPGGSD